MKKTIITLLSTMLVFFCNAQYKNYTTKDIDVKGKVFIGGKYYNKISTDTTLSESSNYSLVTEKAVRSYINYSNSEALLKNFGAVSDVIETVCSISASSNTVTISGVSLNSSYIGKKIQIYKAGTSNGSFQATITSVTNATTCNISSTAKTSVVGVPCLIGTNSKQAILNYIEYAKNQKLNYVKISGKFLIGGDDGDISTGQILSLKYSNFTYDFSGSKIYGCVILWDENGYPKINNCVVKNLVVYSLGDGLDATTGNTNWNGFGIAEGDNNTFENIHVFANGGVRGISVQTENISGGISATQINNFRFTGLVDWDKTDGFDVSGLQDNSINNLQINDVLISNCGRGIYLNSITANSYFNNITINNVSVYNCAKNTFRLFRIKNSKFSNFKLDKTGANSLDAVELNNSKNNELTNFYVKNSASQTNFLISVSDCDDSFIDNIKLISTNQSINGIALFSPNLLVKDIYIENVTTGLYKIGTKCSVKNYTYKLITNPLKDNTIDINLSLENVVEVSNNNVPKQTDLSGVEAKAICQFDGTQANGTLVINKKHNVASVVKTGTGLYTINFNYPINNVVMSGAARYYGGSKIVYISNQPTTTSINIRIEDFLGNLGDSDYVGLCFY